LILVINRDQVIDSFLEKNFVGEDSRLGAFVFTKDILDF
jgi:hypothetical protein